MSERRYINYEYKKQTKLPKKDNRNIYKTRCKKSDTYYDKPIVEINSWSMEYFPTRDVRVPSLKRKSAWKRFYKLFPHLKGHKTITGYSTCSAGYIRSSHIKLK